MWERHRYPNVSMKLHQKQSLIQIYSFQTSVDDNDGKPVTMTSGFPLFVINDHTVLVKSEIEGFRFRD